MKASTFLIQMRSYFDKILLSNKVKEVRLEKTYRF